jgi:hypothetical protein
MTDDELVQAMAALVVQVRKLVAERDQLRRLVKDLQALTIDQQMEIDNLKYLPKPRLVK